MHKQIFLASGFLILVILAYLVADPTATQIPWYSVLPSLFAIYLALAISRISIAFGGALLLGLLLLLYHGGSPAAGAFIQAAYKEVTGWYAIHIVCFVAWIMALVAVLRVSRGLEGLVQRLLPYASTRRRASLLTMALGIIIFFDDYSNTFIVGSSSQPLGKRFRISREKLSFIIDATAAPIAGIALISTWVGFEALQFQEAVTELGITGVQGMALLIQALPYRFYCMLMLLYTALVLLSQRDFGPMYHAEVRALDRGELRAPGEASLSASLQQELDPDVTAVPRALVAWIPLIFLVVSILIGFWMDGGGSFSLSAILSPSAWLAVISQSQQSVVVLHSCAFLASLVSLLCGYTLARARMSTMVSAFLSGLRGAIFPAVILLLAVSLKELCSALQTGEFIAGLVDERFPAMLFPALTFLVSAITAFSIGSSWGTMGILIPVVAPAAFAVEGQFGLLCLVSLASVLDGAILGDHCSPLSDTTILSSLASDCNHQAHVRSQLPYALFVGAFVVLIGYPLAASGVSSYWIVPGMFLAMMGCFYRVSRKLPTPDTM